MSLSLHGVGVLVTSGQPAFLEYLRTAMAPFLTDDDQDAAVRSHLDWVDGAPGQSLAEAFGVQSWERRPDRDLYLDGRSAYWLRIDDFTDLQLAASFDGTLSLRGRYHFNLGAGSGAMERVRRMRWAGDMTRLRARRFSTLLYYLVYYPVLWWLSRYKGWHLLHGGAVRLGTEAAVFAGMPGCGKSTLAVSMLADPACSMLSDNLVLFRASEVRACPELLLLDQSSLEMVGEAAAARLHGTGESRIFEREAYRPDDVVLAPVRAGAVFSIERAARTQCAQLDARQAARRLLAGNIMAKEVRRLTIMSEVLDLISDMPVPDAGADLASLLTITPAYQLGIGEGADFAAVAREYVVPALSGNGRRG